MARKDSPTSSKTASKRKEAPTTDVEETTKRAKNNEVDLEGKNVGNVVGGYKATLKNDSASDEAKQHAEEMIEKLEPMAVDQRETQEGVEGKNVGNVIGGFKATLSNPNASDEAKKHAEKMVEKLGGDLNERKDGHQLSDGNTEGKNPGNVIGGFKATLHNANASDEAKKHAEEMIEKLGGDVNERKDGSELSDGNTEGKNKNNVIGGFKAALHNPNVSDEAKKHAEEMIEKLGGDVNERRSVVERKYRETDSTEGKDLGHVVAGYKATLSNASTSKEAKEHAQKMLDQLSDHHTSGRDIGHVVAGYKATLTNASSSAEAKEHAKRMLAELNKYVSASNKDEKLNRHGKDITQVMSGYKEKLSKSDLSDEDREYHSRAHSHLESHHKAGRHLGHVIGGYKAALSNPNTSEEAKEHARQMLEELGAEDFEAAKTSRKSDGHAKNPNNVLGGYKATLSNPNASEEAKEHAEKVLEENSSSTTGRSGLTGSTGKDDHEKNPGNVIGGLKGALKNPNNSEEAKDEIRAKLDEAKVAY